MFVAETSNMNNYCKLIPTLLSRNQAKNRSILNPMVLSSVQFSCSVASNSLQPHESQHGSLYLLNGKKSQLIQSKEVLCVCVCVCVCGICVFCF